MAEQGFQGLLAGLTNDSPQASDKSTQLPKGPSVNTPTRTEPASSPSTLGPRTA